MGNLSVTNCPKCGAALSDDGLDGLCLKCLGRFGLAVEERESTLLRLGDYELLEEIARGGMGVVYRARQLSLNRIVAVKVVLHGPFSSPDFVQRFRNEAEAAATLRHPNIVSVFEVGESQGHHFLSMEFIDGMNLAELVREQPLPSLRAAEYVKAISEAVQHAHQRGVLHRDLKPSNILLDAFDQPRVTDFGLAKILDRDVELTTTGQVLGSPNHMPPEQAAGKLAQTTAQSDVYSLGAILYQLLTSRPPFQGGTIQEILAQVQNDEPIAPTRLNPSVPADLQTICLKCLQKEPARRYRSAQELADDLGHFLAGEPIRARPVAMLERAWLWGKRRPVFAALSAALFLAVMFGLTGIVWQWRRAEFHARGEKIQRLAAEANAAKTRLNLYAADVNLAAQAIQDNDYGLARRTLDSLRPQNGVEDLRGFEWRYLWNLSRGDQIATLSGHQWIVTCTAFSPDGKWVVSGGMGGEARVWDVEKHSCVRELHPDAYALWSLAFTPDGKVLMISGTEGIQFWDTDSWQLIKKIPGRIASLAGDGASVAISDSSPFYFDEIGPTTVWNWRTGEKLQTMKEQGRALALSPDGRQLALAGKTSSVLICDPASGAVVAILPTEKSVWSVNFSPDGNRLVCAGWCGQALVWNLEHLEKPASPHVISANGHNLWTAKFSPDGKTIVTTSSDQSVRFWDANTYEPGAVLHGHASEVWCAAFSPDGKMLASGGKDQNVLLWSASPQRKSDALTNEVYFRALFSPDGKQLVTVKPDSDYAAQLWDVAKGEPIVAAFPTAAKVTGFSRDGKNIMLFNVSESALEFWSAASLLERSVALEKPSAPKNLIANFGTSPDQGFLFAADVNGRVFIWNTETGKLQLTIKASVPPVRAMMLGPRGEQLAWSIEKENTCHVYDCATHRELLLVGHKDFIRNIAFSPDGSALATCSMDGTVRLWNPTNGAAEGVLPGHMQEATDVAFSPDGRTLASLGQGESLKLWHLPTMREVYSEAIPQAGLWLRFSPDGQRLAVGMRENKLRILEAPSE